MLVLNVPRPCTRASRTRRRAGRRVCSCWSFSGGRLGPRWRACTRWWAFDREEKTGSTTRRVVVAQRSSSSWATTLPVEKLAIIDAAWPSGRPMATGARTRRRASPGASRSASERAGRNRHAELVTAPATGRRSARRRLGTEPQRLRSLRHGGPSTPFQCGRGLYNETSLNPGGDPRMSSLRIRPPGDHSIAAGGAATVQYSRSRPSGHSR